MQKFLLLVLALWVIPHGTSAQCEPQLLDCSAAVQACDLSANDPQYWHEMYWWDNLIQTHDLAEAKIDLSLSIKDTCGGLTLRCLLFLDLDGDGVQETVVDSDSFPSGPNAIFYNNIISGGNVRSFDERPIPLNQKWRFALKTSVSGDTSSFNIRWTTLATPTVYELPELPYGSHKMRWIVTNSAGAVKICEKPFVVKDCKVPTVVCLNGLSVNIMPTQMIQLWASDFLQYSEDNVTPTSQIKIGIRKTGTGAGFPFDANGNPIAHVIFNCDELGTQSVELWAIDAVGNADFCETYVILQDNFGNCGMPPTFIEACVTQACENGLGLDETYFDFSVLSPFWPPTSYFDLGVCGSINFAIPPSEVTITPSNDANPLNGVSTFDMVKIQEFIDGITPFSSPYQWIAADANRDNVVDTLDVLECKKLILGVYTQLPNNTSWRFVDKNHVFPSPYPLSVPFPESITVNSINLPAIDPEFVGVKICDVSCAGLVDFYEIMPENQHLIGQPQPNPTNEGAMLPLQLVTAETVHLEVLDFSGCLLFRTEMSFPSGPALLEIPSSAMTQAGVYVWRVQAGEVAKSGKIVRY